MQRAPAGETDTRHDKSITDAIDTDDTDVFVSI